MIIQLKYKLLSFFVCFSDAAEAWQIGLQDPATPVVEGMIFFHDYVMFFLIVIGFFVMWMLYHIYAHSFFMLFLKSWGVFKTTIKSHIFTDFLLFVLIFYFSASLYAQSSIQKVQSLKFEVYSMISLLDLILVLLRTKLSDLESQSSVLDDNKFRLIVGAIIAPDVA